MRTTVSSLALLLCILGAAGCGESIHLKVATKEDFELRELCPPTADISGHWSGVWRDPVAHISERFTMDLEQHGNAVEGTARFDDAKRSKAAVRGRISSNQVHLVTQPESAVLHEASWRGTLSGHAVKGEWYLHGTPARGASARGTWHGTLGKAR